MDRTDATHRTAPTRPRGRWRFFLYSGIGILMFFVPVTLGETTTIPLDHLVSGLQELLGGATAYVALAIILAGTVRPFVTGRWRQSPARTVFALLNILGLATSIMIVTGAGPEFLFAPDLGPFLYEALVIPVGLLVPVGAVFLALLVGYGLMEYLGVLMQPVMRPLWHTPGRSAIDAVASFVGSYSLGLLITNRVYTSGRYTGREAAIIATGFSTVSATFMVVVARTLDLMHLWLWYFFLTLVVTYAVTVIVVRIPPISRIPEEYFPGATPQPEERISSGRLRAAWRASGESLEAAPGVVRNMSRSFLDGLLMAMQILPSIMSIGLIGLILATFTPVFEWLGYLFLPLTWALQLPDPQLAATASALGIAEMFLPATLVAGHESELLRLVIGVVCVSGIIFFSALVPSVLATEIPVKIWQLVVIWVQRVLLTLLFATPLAALIIGVT
ncbi:YjiH family protein [Nesterenkonia xinjiangensis]|uniref:Nucleoside recognition membrane protein YjiH n=1 Tax=Nesterenkonia xinjiangensis TaxID=225327 RepID=A0A7Z0GIR3_9MICC|nr:YjiH family protein [Nesterenkonia xinjiangensis]NYJ76740.1 nucleoside recognition membrane protein YjiH [Nesterenkonia xinjiangensis]